MNYDDFITSKSFEIENSGFDIEKEILNENLFKRNYKRKHSLYGNNYYSDKNLKNKFEINYFNNQILQNKNWGNDNDINKYRSGRRSFTNTIQKSDGINMRTRKKM